MQATKEVEILARLLYKPEEVAAYLRVKVETLEVWRSRGEGPKFVKVGGVVRYRGEDVLAFPVEPKPRVARPAPARRGPVRATKRGSR